MRSDMENHDADPVIKTFRESPSFNRAWLGNERLSAVQRVGFLLLSSLVSFAGFRFLRDGLQFVREEILTSVMMASAGALILYLGLRGLWRVVRDIFSKTVVRGR